MKKLILLIISLIIIGTAFFIYNKTTLSPSNIILDNVNTDTFTSTESTTPDTFTLDDINKHDTESDCYTTINGVVYDLTSFIHEHPGGDRNILKICGKDGSSAFDRQHGGQYRPEQTLKGFEIGLLVK